MAYRHRNFSARKNSWFDDETDDSIQEARDLYRKKMQQALKTCPDESELKFAHKKYLAAAIQRLDKFSVDEEDKETLIQYIKEDFIAFKKLLEGVCHFNSSGNKRLKGKMQMESQSTDITTYMCTKLEEMQDQIKDQNKVIAKLLMEKQRGGGFLEECMKGMMLLNLELVKNRATERNESRMQMLEWKKEMEMLRKQENSEVAVALREMRMDLHGMENRMLQMQQPTQIGLINIGNLGFNRPIFNFGLFNLFK